MSAAVWFLVVFVGYAFVRLGIASLFFYAVLDDDDRCPMCDAVTIRVQAKGWNTLMPWFRTSYCIDCRWEGLLRHSKAPPPPASPTRAPIIASRGTPSARR